MKFRWLGVAGIELVLNHEHLVIDTYLTRAPLLNLFFGRVASDGEQLRRYLPACDHLLITHAHFDHLLDGAEILRYSGAGGYGSVNACRLMQADGIPDDCLHVIHSGDRLQCGPFRVDVHHQDHPMTPINPWINGSLPAHLQAPFKLMDYRMDEDFAFLVQAQGLRVLVGDFPVPADVHFTVPLRSLKYYTKLVSKVQPRLIVPIHWDNLFLPLEKIQSRSSVLKRVRGYLLDRLLIHFKRGIESIPRTSPSTGRRVMIPQLFQSYQLEVEMQPVIQPEQSQRPGMGTGI